jgi:hypothetical protein
VPVPPLGRRHRRRLVRVVIDQTDRPIAFSGQAPPSASSTIPVAVQKDGLTRDQKIAVEVKAEQAGAMVGDSSIVGIIGPMF